MKVAALAALSVLIALPARSWTASVGKTMFRHLVTMMAAVQLLT